jgi:hypothetical protein
MAVAVWPGKPGADGLLRERLRQGWTPTPTRLQQGPAILGHAACLSAGGPGRLDGADRVAEVPVPASQRGRADGTPRPG